TRSVGRGHRATPPGERARRGAWPRRDRSVALGRGRQREGAAILRTRRLGAGRRDTRKSAGTNGGPVSTQPLRPLVAFTLSVQTVWFRRTRSSTGVEPAHSHRLRVRPWSFRSIGHPRDWRRSFVANGVGTLALGPRWARGDVANRTASRADSGELGGEPPIHSRAWPCTANAC